MKRVILESPYASTHQRLRDLYDRYLVDCLRDSLGRGEAPMASHGLYPGALDDEVPEERSLGIEAGFAWRQAAEYTVAYTDLGTSPGMRKGIEHAISTGHVVHLRCLGGAWAGVPTNGARRWAVCPVKSCDSDLDPDSLVHGETTGFVLQACPAHNNAACAGDPCTCPELHAGPRHERENT